MAGNFKTGYYLVHLKVADDLKPGPGVLYLTWNGDSNQATLNNPDLYNPTRQRMYCEVTPTSKTYSCKISFELWKKDKITERYFLSVDKAAKAAVDFRKDPTQESWTLVGTGEPTPYQTYSFDAIKTKVDGQDLNLNFKNFGLEVTGGALTWELIPARGGSPPSQD